MPINILYIINTLGYGGTERQLVELIHRLDRSRFQPHLCTLKASAALIDGLDVPKLFLEFSGFSHPSCLNQLWRLWRYVRTHNIHLIQTFFQDPFLLAAMIKPFHKVKLIGSFRDLGFWRTSSENRKMRFAYPFFDGFIANSLAVKEHFINIDGLSPERIEVIYNGIDISSISEKQPRKKFYDPPLVGIVANLNRPVKRVEDFIKAAALVIREVPQAIFVVVGDGHLRPKLESLANSVGLSDKITFTGRVDNPLQIVATFQIGVITSETEGFCNAIMEYMACGVPVIATNAGGNSELIEDGVNGVLVPVGDCQTLSRRLIELISNRTFAEIIGMAGYKSVQSLYSIEDMVTKYEIHYENNVL